MGHVSLLMLDAVLLLGRLANRDKSLSESLRSMCASQHTHWLSTVTAGSMLCTSLAHWISLSLILLCSLNLDGEHSACKHNLIWSGKGWEEINSELGVCNLHTHALAKVSGPCQINFFSKHYNAILFKGSKKRKCLQLSHPWTLCSPSWEIRTASPRGRYGGTPSAWPVYEAYIYKTPPVGQRQPVTSIPARPQYKGRRENISSSSSSSLTGLFEACILVRVQFSLYYYGEH